MGRRLSQVSSLTFTRQGGVGRITLERVAKKNALGRAELDELKRLCAALHDDDQVDVVVAQAQGDFFCAGVDLTLIREVGASRDVLVSLVADNAAIVASLERLPQLCIVVLNGPALGLGAHLALAADYLLAAEGAYLQFPESRLGFPDLTHLELLQQRLGRSAALDLLLRGRRLDAAEARQAGLIHSVHASEALAGVVEALVEELLAIPPVVRRVLKERCVAALPPSSVLAQAQAFSKLPS